nr:peroxidase 3 [Geocoris pallidipennis]
MTLSQRFLPCGVKMLFQHSTATTATLLLSIIALSIAPPHSVLSLTTDSPFYKYIFSGLERFEEYEKAKRSVGGVEYERLVVGALDQARDSLRHLTHFEGVLHGRKLEAAAGTPAHTAIICSWPEDEALSVARNSYLLTKASYLLSYQMCMRHGKPTNLCINQISKLPLTKMEMVQRCEENLYRTFNGSCNNELHPSWGSAFTAYSRILPASYMDGIWEPKEKGMVAKLANAVEISEGVQKKTGKILKDITLNTASWAGLVAYDMSHTVSNRMFSTGDPIICCEGNKWKLSPRHRHPLCMPVTDKKETKCFDYVRSMLAPSEDHRFGPADQMNGASHFLDGSGIYGTTNEVSLSLRTGNMGQVRVINLDGEKSMPHLISSSSQNYPFTGEMRLNTDVISAVMHVVLINEHNRVAEELSKINPKWDDEKLYQEARRIVIAELQHITYNEWLPVLLGNREVSRKELHIPEAGYAEVYNPKTRPSVANSFANAAMRFIVSLLDEKIHLFNEERIPSGNISLRFSLIEPKMLAEKEQLASLVRSLSTQNCQANDLYFPEAVTKYLYSSANGTGFNYLSMDIQRGRDHGLPPYVAFRKLYGLPSESFDDLIPSIRAEVVSNLKKTYEKVSAIDLIVGGLAETPLRGSLLGPVFSNIIAQQMVVTRTGDRYFYDNKNQPYPFSEEQLEGIRQISLARLLCDNTSVKKMQPHAFRKPNTAGNKLVDCSDINTIKRLNLKLWRAEEES